MSRKVSRAGNSLQLVTIGAFVIYAGFLLVLAAAVIALSVFIPIGWAALVVGVTVLLAGAITMLIGKKRLSKSNFIPHETIDTIKADTKWMHDQLM
jgi:predicted phage tail protein